MTEGMNLMAIIKVKISEARVEYLEHLEARGVKASTRRVYEGTINALIKGCGDIYMSTLSAEHMDKLFRATNWQASTRNVRRGMLNSFFAWSRNRRYMRQDFDPLLGWRSIRVPEKDRLRIPVQEWGKLFAAADSPIKRVLIALGLYTFLRGSEIQALQIQHVDLENKLLSIYRIKTESRDEMPICVELEEHLRNYLTWYSQRLQQQGDSLTAETYLVPAQVRGTHQKVNHRFVKGTARLNPHRAHSRPHRIVQEVLQDAGYSDQMIREGVHTLRRSGARAYFDSLVDRGYDGALRRVQSMLGHSNTIVTETYLGIKLDREQRNRELAGHHMFQVETAETTLRVVGT